MADVQGVENTRSYRRSRSLLRSPCVSLATGLLLLVVVVLTAPTIPVKYGWLQAGSGAGIGGVFALPCAVANASIGTIGEAQQVVVTPNAAVNLETVFDCEDGDFDVFWSGIVNVSSTIYIGSGTTVKIVGDTTDTATSNSSANRTSAVGGVDLKLSELSSELSIPSGLTSAVVGIRPASPTALDDTSFGPIFFVDGGELLLEGLAVRDGFATNSTNSLSDSGGGVHAIDSNVTVIGCEFEDNFAEHWGGGIYANRSTLVVVDTVFRSCNAGVQSFAGDVSIDRAGGGIGVRFSFTGTR